MLYNFHLSRKLNCSFEEAVNVTTAALKKQGFGIITSIDIRATFREKLNKDFRNYIILGACNPGYAYQALETDDKIGVYLPCNVVVQEHRDGSIEVSAVNPEQMVQGKDDPGLSAFAAEVKSGLEAALDNLNPAGG